MSEAIDFSKPNTRFKPKKRPMKYYLVSMPEEMATAMTKDARSHGKSRSRFIRDLYEHHRETQHK